MVMNVCRLFGFLLGRRLWYVDVIVRDGRFMMYGSIDLVVKLIVLKLSIVEMSMMLLRLMLVCCR